MIEQLHLELPDARKPPRADPADIDQLCSFLEGRGWLRAIAIESHFPLWKSSDHRYIRSLASEAKGRILSFPGSPGYRLSREATIDELWRARHVFARSQAEDKRRLKEIDAIIHRRSLS